MWTGLITLSRATLRCEAWASRLSWSAFHVCHMHKWSKYVRAGKLDGGQRERVGRRREMKKKSGFAFKARRVCPAHTYWLNAYFLPPALLPRFPLFICFFSLSLVHLSVPFQYFRIPKARAAIDRIDLLRSTCAAIDRIFFFCKSVCSFLARSLKLQADIEWLHTFNTAVLAWTS